MTLDVNFNLQVPDKYRSRVIKARPSNDILKNKAAES